MLCVALFLAPLCSAISLFISSDTPFDAQQLADAARRGATDREPLDVVDIDGTWDRESFRNSVVLDYTLREDAKDLLCSLSGLYIGMYLGDQRTSAKGKWSEYGGRVVQFMEEMKLSQATLMTNSQPRNLRITQWMLAAYPELFSSLFIIPPQVDAIYAMNFTGRLLKPSGKLVFVFFLDPLSTYNFLLAVEAKNLNKPGYVYLLSEEASCYRQYLTPADTGLVTEGALFIAEFPAGLQPSVLAMEGVVLEDVLVRLETNANSTRNPQFGLFSVENGAAFLSAASPSDISDRTIYRFPGNSTSIPTLMKPKLTALVNYQLINPDMTLYPPSPMLMRGFQIAFEEVNSRDDLLPNYFVEDQSVNYTGMAFSYNYTKGEILRSPHPEGLAFMTAPSAQSIMGLHDLFAELNMRKPIIACSLSTRLSDPKTYPLYLRPRVGNRFQIIAMARVIRILGWQHTNVLYTKGEEDYADGYEMILKVFESYNIKIANRESLRVLPATLNNDTTEAVNAALQEIISTGVRIMIVLHTFSYVIMEQMYDLGIREGYIGLFASGVHAGIFGDPTFYKRRVVCQSCIVFIPKLFAGATGARVYKELLKRDGRLMVPNTCQYYDGAMLFFHATDFMLNRGANYESSEELTKTMRSTYFDGCCGLFKIEDGSNDRAASQIDLWQFQYNAAADNFTFSVQANYDSLATTIFTITGKLIWPDGKDTYGDSKPSYNNCPYLSESVRDLPEGHFVAYVVCGSISVATIVVTILIWRRWWNVPCRPLVHVHALSIEDVLVFVTIMFDFFQFAAMGPDTSHISHALESITSSFVLKLDDFFAFTRGVYWIMLDIVFGIVSVWSILCITKFTGADRKIGKCCGCLEWWSDLLMPTFGNMLFLPIIATLLNVFLCYKASGPNLADTFLNKDCSEHCWTKMHIAYISASSLCLLLYTPFAVFSRPLWQDTQLSLHIKASPLGLMMKSVVQVVLIVVSVLLKTDHSEIQAYLFFAIVSLYIMFLVRVRQFNYLRLCLWQLIVMVAMLLLEVVAFVTKSMSVASVGKAIGVLGTTYLLLVGMGIVLQLKVKMFESKLHRTDGMDVRYLFRFAFTFGKVAEEALQAHLATNRRRSPRRLLSAEHQIVVSS